jgi:small-conductance mechanosensitive channel
VTFLDIVYLNNSIRDWLIAAAVAIIVYAGANIIRRLVIRQISALSSRTQNEADDLVADTLRRTKTYFLLFVSLYAASRVLELTEPMETALRFVGVIVVVAQLAVWGTVVINTLVQRQMARRIEEDAATATTINALGFVIRLAFYSILVLMGLDNLGFEIGPLIAGLGIGGVAVALALQNVLGDLFASLSIVLDRPFVIGDFIIVDDLAGTVEYVGLKTTRVKALSGEQLVFANSDLLASRVRNFKRMYERRIVFGLGVTYDTPRAKLEQIPGMIRAAVEAQEQVRFDRAHFLKYGAFSLDFETVYYVLVPEYNTYMDVQQAINFEIHRAFEAAGIEFAFPTQTIHMAGT